jgi:hypothetical protein
MSDTEQSPVSAVSNGDGDPVHDINKIPLTLKDNDNDGNSSKTSTKSDGGGDDEHLPIDHSTIIMNEEETDHVRKNNNEENDPKEDSDSDFKQTEQKFSEIVLNDDRTSSNSAEKEENLSTVDDIHPQNEGDQESTNSQELNEQQETFDEQKIQRENAGLSNNELDSRPGFTQRQSQEQQPPQRLLSNPDFNEKNSDELLNIIANKSNKDASTYLLNTVRNSIIIL